MGWSFVTNHTGMPRRPRLRATARLPWAPPRIRAPRGPRTVVPVGAGPPDRGAVMARIFLRPWHRRNCARDVPRDRPARRGVSAVFQHRLGEFPRREVGAGHEA